MIEIYKGRIHPQWYELLAPFLESDKMQKIYKQLNQDKQRGAILPHPDLLFNAFNHFAPRDTKVIIFGQDPYPNKRNAMGLCFSSPANLSIPASLHTIFREIGSDVYGIKYPIISNKESILAAQDHGQLSLDFCDLPLEEIENIPVEQDLYAVKGDDKYLKFNLSKSEAEEYINNCKEYYAKLEITANKYLRSPDLTDWAKQGVLLLNTALTVIEGEPNSHTALWAPFTDFLMEVINTKLYNTVILCWGKKAQEFGYKVDPFRHTVLDSPHPSPLARGGFLGNRHFSSTNKLLEHMNKSPIIW